MSKTICRVCGSKTTSVFSLGELYPSTFVKSQEGLVKYETELCKCLRCGIIQIGETPTLDNMYRQYWYTSSLNPSMLTDLKDVVQQVESVVELNNGDIVVDIGCNVGALFDFYTNENLVKVGFDPALNLAEEARKHCSTFVNDFFPSQSYVFDKKVKVFTTIAMFYDVPDPHSFIENVKQNLDDQGIWVIQFTDLYSMFKVNAVDNICHEHLIYYTLNQLNELLNEHCLYIYRVDYNKVNGGSVRVIVGHKNIITYNVMLALQIENYYFISYEGSFESFIQRAEMRRKQTVEFISSRKAYRQPTFLLGASTKANTLLQWYGLDHSFLPFAGEVNKDKFGLFTPGTNIEIISEQDLLAKYPDYLLVGPWHFIDMLLKKPAIKKHLNFGMSLVVPLPNFRIYTKMDLI